MISLTGRAGARRMIAVGTAVGLTLGAVAIVRSQTAEAATKTTPFTLSCLALGIPQTVTTSITTTTSPDPLHSGDTVTLAIDTATPTGIALDIPVTSVGITIPIPEQVDQTKPSSVVLAGGNLSGSGSVVNGALRITMTGTGVTSFTMQIPKMTITSTLKSGIGGQTINWAGPAAMDIEANLAGTPIPVACTPAATNGPVAVTPVMPDMVPTTAAPTTAAPTTAAPTTAAPTTAAPTTRPPTTAAPTTAAPTTAAPTTRPPTTAAPTTRPPTTAAPTTAAPTTAAPTTAAPTTRPPTTAAPTTRPPTTAAPTTKAPTTKAPTTKAPTTRPGTRPPTTMRPPHGGDPLAALIKLLLCLLFRMGC